MIRPATSVLRLIMAHCLLAGTIPGQSGNGEEPDGIAAAQREFQNLRTPAKVTDEKLQLQLPEVATRPELSGAPPVQPRQRMTDSPTKAKRENWLLEAMLQAEPADPDAPRAWTEKDAEPEHLRDPFEVLIAEAARPKPRDEIAHDQAERGNGRENPVIAAPNPFAAYMGAWISPRHRELLITPPTARDAATASMLMPAVAQPAMSAPMLGGNAPGGDLGRSTALPGDPVTPFSLIEPAPNPFLPAADYRPPELPSPISAGPAPAATPAPTAPAPPPQQTPPLPVKPADDAKYFPQLKRF